MKVICIAGSIASGKSTLSNAIAATVENSVLCSFSATVRRHAELESTHPDRAALQATGELLITQGWASFVEETIGQVDESTTSLLVIDGVRHVAALREIARQTDRSHVSLVFVATPDDVAMQRIGERGESVHDASHSVESEVPHLKELADIIIDGSRPIDDTVAVILRHISIDSGAHS